MSPALAALVAVTAGLGSTLVQCSEKPKLDEVFEPPRRIEAPAISSSGWSEFALAPGSRAEFELGSRQRRVRGHVAMTQGRLQIDLGRLSATRGQLSFDLATLEIDSATSDEEASPAVAGASLTEQSLWWLEVAAGESLTPRPQLRYAHFVIQSVGGLSARAAHEGRVVKATPDRLEGRRIDLRVSGELELHGFRIPYTSPVTAIFRWSRAAGADSPPEEVELSLGEGLGIDLIEHEILPRDARGDVRAEAVAELRKPGKAHVARVTGTWRARRAPAAAAPAPARARR